MENITPHILTLITRYLTHTANHEEEQMLRVWLREDPENIRQFKEFREIWLVPSEKDFSKARSAFEKFDCKIEMAKKRSFSFRQIFYGGIAACTTGLILLMSFLFYNKTSVIEQSEQVFCKVIMPVGCKGNVLLPDSSVVWLNSGSTLIYPEHFADNSRELTLSGEGYFEVTKNPDAPFLLKTDHMTIRVLGTSFNVRSYPEDEIVETTLLSGSVQVRMADKSDYRLTPNQQITFNTQKNLCQLKEVRAADFGLWKDRALSFENEPLNQILQKLSHWYHIPISDPQELTNSTHLSFTLIHETKEELFQILESITPFKFRIQKDHSVTVLQ